MMENAVNEVEFGFDKPVRFNSIFSHWEYQEALMNSISNFGFILLHPNDRTDVKVL